MLLPNNALALLKEIKESSRALNKWEKGFIASVSIQAKQGRYLNTQQADKLNQIHQSLESAHGSL